MSGLGPLDGYDGWKTTDPDDFPPPEKPEFIDPDDD